MICSCPLLSSDLEFEVMSSQQRTEAGEPGVPDHLQLHSKSEGSLGHRGASQKSKRAYGLLVAQQAGATATQNSNLLIFKCVLSFVIVDDKVTETECHISELHFLPTPHHLVLLSNSLLMKNKQPTMII